MASFNFNEDIPQSTDVISQSQPELLQNFQSIDNIWNEDHYTFESSISSDGQHKQVRFPANGTAGSPTGLQSTLYTAPGTADAATSQLFFKNSLSVLPISLFKAYGAFTVSGSTITLANGSNMGSPTYTSAGRYVINLSITLPTTSYGVLVTPWTPSNGGFPNITVSYVIASASQFNLFFQNTSGSSAIDVPAFTVIVLQV